MKEIGSVCVHVLVKRVHVQRERESERMGEGERVKRESSFLKSVVIGTGNVLCAFLMRQT